MRKVHFGTYFVTASIVCICIIGLYLPLYEFIRLDGDSISYVLNSKRSLAESIRLGFSHWGIYRSLAIALKTLVYANLEVSTQFALYSILFSVAAKMLFVFSLFRFLKFGFDIFPFVLSAAICNIFFLDIALMLSRSINDFIGSMLGALFLYICSKEQVCGERIFLVSLLFVFVGLVGYESYIVFAFPLVIIFRKDQASNVIGGLLSGICIVALMQSNGFYLNHPKLVNASASALQQSYALPSYAVTKFNQFFISIQTIELEDLIYSLVISTLLFIALQYSYGIWKKSLIPLETRSATVISGALIAVSGLLPTCVALLTAQVGPQGSRIQWLLIGGVVWMMAIGCVAVENKLHRAVKFANVAFSLVFFISILLVLQLAKSLGKRDYAYIDSSIFRNLPIVYYIRNMDSK